jgi:hypothetical protein
MGRNLIVGAHSSLLFIAGIITSVATIALTFSTAKFINVDYYHLVSYFSHSLELSLALYSVLERKKLKLVVLLLF